MAEQHLLCATGIQALAGQAAVRQCPERINIGATIDHAAADLLGGHVIGCADQYPGACQAGRVERFGDTKIGDQRARWCVWLVLEQDVGGLDIAVHDPARVGGIERGGDLHDDRQQLGGWDRVARAEHLGQRAPHDQAHGDIRCSRLFANIIDRHDTRMVERGGGSGLAPEALDIGGVIHILRVEHFKGDITAQQRIVRPVNRGHATTPQYARDLVAPKSASFGHARILTAFRAAIVACVRSYRRQTRGADGISGQSVSE